MSHFHRSLSAAITKNVGQGSGEGPKPTGAGESFLLPGPHLATALGAPHERQDGTAGGGSASPATQPSHDIRVALGALAVIAATWGPALWLLVRAT